MLRGSRVVGVAAVGAAVVLMSVLPAAAVPPRAGATYKGHVIGAADSFDLVTFHVSTNGSTVRHLRIGPYPLNACGSGGNPPDQSAKPAPIKNGRFTAHVVFTGGGDVIARTTVTGTFLRGGKEKGTVTSVIVGAPDCGMSLPYRTHAL